MFDDSPVGGPRERRSASMRFRLAVGALAVGLSAAACSSGSTGPGVASGGTTSTTAGSSSGGNAHETFSQCMRAHGISDFPDPGPGGAISITKNTGDLNPSSPAFLAARQACQSYVSSGATGGAPDAQVQGDLLRFAQCMRAHGISDFPDPNSSGGIALPGGMGDLNRNSPLYQAASRACQSILPGGGPGGGPSGGGGSAP